MSDPPATVFLPVTIAEIWKDAEPAARHPEYRYVLAGPVAELLREAEHELTAGAPTGSLRDVASALGAVQAALKVLEGS